MAEKHKFPAEHAARLDNPERRRLLPPEEILQFMGLAPGDSLVDVGCGTGYFALPAARLVGETGRVYALDTSLVMLGKLREKLDAVGNPGNIQVSLSQEDALGLPDGCASFVLLAVVLHELADEASLLGEVRRVLRPGGRLGVVEWKKDDDWQPGAGPPPGERLTAEEADAVVSAAGFRLEKQWEPGPLHYCLVFLRE